MIRRSVVLLSCLTACGAASAGEPSPTEIARLIEMLGDRDYRSREFATKRLYEVGAAAVPHLTHVGGEHPERAERAARLVAAITEKLENEKALAATRIELPTGEPTVRQLVEAIERQCPVRFLYDDNAEVRTKTVRLTGGKKTFWESVQLLERAAALEVESVSEHAGVGFIPNGGVPVCQVVLRPAGGQKPAPLCMTGAVRIEAVLVSPDLLKRYAAGHLPLKLRVRVEPRVRGNRVTEVRISEALDESGRIHRPNYFTPKTYSTLANDELQFRRATLGLMSDDPDRLVPADSGIATLVADNPAKPVGLKKVSGLVITKVWTVPGELATAFGLSGGSRSTRCESSGVQLVVRLVDPKRGEFEATLRYNPDTVRLTQVERPAELLVTPDLRQRVTSLRQSVPTGWTDRHRLIARDLDGQEIPVRGVSESETEVYDGGRQVKVVRVRYQFVPTRPEQTVTLASVAVHGSRLKEVPIPFTLTDVPLSPGTGDGKPLPENYERR